MNRRDREELEGIAARLGVMEVQVAAMARSGRMLMASNENDLRRFKHLAELLEDVCAHVEEMLGV